MANTTGLFLSFPNNQAKRCWRLNVKPDELLSESVKELPTQDFLLKFTHVRIYEPKTLDQASSPLVIPNGNFLKSYADAFPNAVTQDPS